MDRRTFLVGTGALLSLQCTPEPGTDAGTDAGGDAPAIGTDAATDAPRTDTPVVCGPGGLVVPPYDAATFTFDEITLPGTGPCERRASTRAPWEPFSSATGAITFRPTWRDVGASYRTRCEGMERTTEIDMPVLTGLDPADHGAAGDGETDDTMALTRALAAAAEMRTGLNLMGRTYAIGAAMQVVEGVTAVFGGTLRQTVSTSSLYLFGKAQGADGNCHDLVLANLTFVSPTVPVDAGIVGLNVSNVAIVRCRLEGSRSFPIALINRPDGVDPTSEIVLRDNVILRGAADSSTHGHGIDLSCDIDLLGHLDVPAYWREHHRGPAPWGPMSRIYVGANEIEGGYYGISLSAVTDVVVEHNVVRQNVRNLSAQNSCQRLLVRRNEMRDSISSSIHLAYGSSDNTITENDVQTSRAIGEGLLQAYVGTARNVFSANTTMASGTGPRYHAYCGVECDDNVFDGNTHGGTCVRAYVALEAAWDSTNPHPAHYGAGLPLGDGFARGDSTGNRITNNTITPGSPVEAICLADVDDAFGSWRLVGTVVEGNAVVGGDATPHRYVG